MSCTVVHGMVSYMCMSRGDRGTCAWHEGTYILYGQTGGGIPFYPLGMGVAAGDHGRIQPDRHGAFRPISRRRSVLYIYRIATYVICLCLDIPVDR